MKNRSLRLFFWLLLLVSTAVRLFLSIYQNSAIIYPDELYTLELAQNIWHKASFSVYGTPANYLGILYPLLLSPFYLITDGILRNLLISAFNAVLISSSLIPAYLLARRILKNNTHIALALLAVALSPNLLFSLTYMSENLYLPLLLWTFWALHRFISERQNKGQLALPLLALFAALLLLTGASGLSLRPISWANFSTSPHLMYLLYIILLLTLYSLASLFWFPVALPFLFRKKLSPANRALLYTTLAYSFCAMILIALKLSLAEDFASLSPHIYLRYLLGCGYPFLLIFLSCMENEEGTKVPDVPRSLLISTALFTLLSLLILFIPDKLGLADFPALHLLSRLNPLSAKQLWALKLALVAFLALALFLWSRKNRKPFLCLVMVPLLALEAACSASFALSLRNHSKITDQAALAEVKSLDQSMDAMEGPILVISNDAEEPLLKLLNTVSDNDYRMLTKADLLDQVLDQGPDAGPVVSLPLPADNLVTLGAWDLVDPAAYQDTTSADTPSFTLWKAQSPATALSLLAPNAISPGESIRFAGEDPNYRRFYAKGFSSFEDAFTWTEAPEVSLTLRPALTAPCDLAAHWSWCMSNGDQSCEIYANDTLVCSQTLTEADHDLTFRIPAEAWYGSDTLTLRFVFPDARQPGNGDPRTLAFAFTSLTLATE